MISQNLSAFSNKYRGTESKSVVVTAMIFCFKITQKIYLVVRLFHDVMQTNRNDICDTTFVGWTYVPWFGKM